MGSKSDWEVMQNVKQTLEKFGISHECRVLSAHRTPHETADFVKQAESREARPRRRLKLDPPIVPSRERKFDLTNEQIYELIEFP